MSQPAVFQINDSQIKSCLIREKDLVFASSTKTSPMDFLASDTLSDRFIYVPFAQITELSYPQDRQVLSLDYQTSQGMLTTLELRFDSHQTLIEFMNHLTDRTPLRKEVQDDPVAQKIMLPSMLLGLFVYIGFAMVVILKDLHAGIKVTSFDPTPVGFLQKYLTSIVETLGQIGTYTLAAAMVLGGVYLFIKTITQKSKVFIYERSNP